MQPEGDRDGDRQGDGPDHREQDQRPGQRPRRDIPGDLGDRLGLGDPPPGQPHDEGVSDPQRRPDQPGQRLLPRFGVDQAGAEQARHLEGDESRQAEGDDEPDVEKIGRDESVQAVCHRQPAQQRGHEGGQHHEPPGPAADAEPQGRQQRAGRGDHGQPGHPVAVVPAGVAHGHDQRPEDRREEVSPLRREHAHDDQQPQHDRKDDACAQVESLPVELEYLRHLAHDSPLSTLAWDRPSSPPSAAPDDRTDRESLSHPRRAGPRASPGTEQTPHSFTRRAGQPFPLEAKVRHPAGSHSGR